MSNEKHISLSQAEVDRLLGQTSNNSESTTEKIFERKTIANDNEISKFNEMLKKFTVTLKDHLKEIFSEQGIRKITPGETVQMSRVEFMESISDNDFLFLVEIENYELLLKFDSFLFCALSGISFNINHKSNLFQNETIRKVVAPIVVGDILKAAKKHEKPSDVKITPLFDLPALEGLNTDTAGISASFTWNEGFKSIGIEKMFFEKNFLNFLLT